MSVKVDSNFSQAQSDNLPMVDSIMVMEFFTNPDFISAEMRGIKTKKSARESYGDNAIGYVQLKRDGNKCIVKGKVCPEHRVRMQQYNVTVVVDEVKKVIDSAKCFDCVASLGGCKHIVSFVMWIHRRSEQPSPTAVECYWKKSRLASIGTSLKFIYAKGLGKPLKEVKEPENAINFLQDYLAVIQARKIVPCQLITQLQVSLPERKLSVWQTLLSFVIDTRDDHLNYKNFFNYFRATVSQEVCSKVEVETRDQTDTPLWYELRHARITASKLYGAAHCHKPDGVFVEEVLGSLKIKDSLAMQRGRCLEKEVLKVVEKRLGVHFKKCGLVIPPFCPIIGASPDAIALDFVVEVKCPSSEKSYKSYKTVKNEITAKYNAQVQLQMFVTNRRQALFCIADHNFEKNKNVEIIWVEQDLPLTVCLLNKALSFWKNNIFLILLNAAKK